MIAPLIALLLAGDIPSQLIRIGDAPPIDLLDPYNRRSFRFRANELTGGAGLFRGQGVSVASVLMDPGRIAALPDYLWMPLGCSAAPYTFAAVRGGLTIPESVTNNGHTCGASMGAVATHELFGTGAGLALSGVGSALYTSGGVTTGGAASWVNTTVGSIPAFTGENHVFCVLFRPNVSFAGYLFRAASTATEYFNMRAAAGSLVAETRGDGSGNLTLVQSNTGLADTSGQHWACMKWHNVCPSQVAGRGCLSVNTDGQSTDGAEVAAPSPTAYAAQSFVSIASDSVETNRFNGDVYAVAYWHGASADSVFGTSFTSFRDGARSLCQSFGVCTANTEVTLIVGLGQSPMVGAEATPVLTSADQVPHREFLGFTNSAPLLHEGTPVVNNTESRMSSACTELAKWRPGTLCVVMERGVSSTAIATHVDGQPNFDTAETWLNNGLGYSCGRFTTVRVIILWHQGENDFPDNAAWGTTLAAIQDSWDTLIRAMPCVQNVEIKMLMMESSTWTGDNFNGGAGFSQADLVTERQFPAATSDNPGEIYLIGPAYHGPYAGSGAARLHPNNVFQDRLGREAGRAIATLIGTGDFQGVKVTAANVASNVVTVDFYTPVPPLSITCDGTDGVTDPNNRGFEWSDASSRTITGFGSVTCDSGTGPTTCHVPITLSAAPGGSRVLGVARTAQGSLPAGAGNTSGVRSCIHDSSRTFDGALEPYWAAHQRVVVP